MLKSRFFRKILKPRFEDIDQVKLLYLLSLIVGLLSALAAAILKNAVHYTHQILTGGITRESGNYLYLAYPITGMFLTVLF
ncbi:MAG: chloride channel protein, partial [Bacteroidetes bacterium]|nr:chloride channel protein [Bacteroidota bacterium]